MDQSPLKAQLPAFFCTKRDPQKPFFLAFLSPSHYTSCTSSEGGGMINRYRLLWAGFLAILAAGLGFAIRGGIFADWSHEFGFSATELGTIGGAGFTDFASASSSVESWWTSSDTASSFWLRSCCTSCRHW
jgi:hypothetical protein